MKNKRKLLFSALFVLVVTLLFAVPAFAAPKLNKTKHTMVAGQSYNLKVKGTKKKVTWSSTNKKVATVSKTGVVKAKKAGNATIKAKVGGTTLKCKILVFAATEEEAISGNGLAEKVAFTFKQEGWYVARFVAELYDRQNGSFSMVYSDSCAIGEKARLIVDTEMGRYKISRVGYQIWAFGWGSMYCYMPWQHTDYAVNYTLSGSGKYPKFSWDTE